MLAVMFDPLHDSIDTLPRLIVVLIVVGAAVVAFVRSYLRMRD